MKAFAISIICVVVLCAFGLPLAHSSGSIQGGPPSNLVAHWAFDEGTGSTAGDSSGNGYDGTIHGAAWAAGKSGNALDFNGINNYVAIGASASLDNMKAISFEAWIKPKADTHWHVLDKGDGDKRLYAEGNNLTLDGRVRYDTGGTHAYSQSVNHTVLLGEWQHVAMTWNISDNTTRLYHNGAEVSYRSQSVGTVHVQNDNDFPFTIGARGALGSGTFFNGTIDEVYLWNRTLTPAEILSHYNSQKIPEPAAVLLLAPAIFFICALSVRRKAN